MSFETRKGSADGVKGLNLVFEVMVVGFFVGGVPLTNSLSGLLSLAFSLSPVSSSSGISWAVLCLGTPGGVLEGRVSGRESDLWAHFSEEMRKWRRASLGSG